jgi:hypothetical protein
VKSAFGEIDPLRIRALERPDQISPGQTAKYVLECVLPGSLRPRSSYHGLFRLFDAAVAIVVNPAQRDGVDTSEPPHKRPPKPEEHRR